MCVGFVQTVAGAAVPIMKKFELNPACARFIAVLVYWFF
jgi:hypothetical protein